MVMRKFKRSLDHTAEADPDPALSESAISQQQLIGMNSPRLSRKNRGSSGEALNSEVPASPGLRRRRSRIPSEEDDKLINFLVTGGHDGSRERNLSVGNLGARKRDNILSTSSKFCT